MPLVYLAVRAGNRQLGTTRTTPCRLMQVYSVAVKNSPGISAAMSRGKMKIFAIFL